MTVSEQVASLYENCKQALKGADLSRGSLALFADLLNVMCYVHEHTSQFAKVLSGMMSKRLQGGDVVVPTTTIGEIWQVSRRTSVCQNCGEFSQIVYLPVGPWPSDKPIRVQLGCPHCQYLAEADFSLSDIESVRVKGIRLDALGRKVQGYTRPAPHRKEDEL